MKLKTVALLAGGAVAFYLLRTPQGRERLARLRTQADRLLDRPDVQRNLNHAAQAAKDASRNLGPIAGPATRFVADQVQHRIPETPTAD